MKHLDPASKGRTYEHAGAQFMCGDLGTDRPVCDIKMLASVRSNRLIAGDLLEQTGDWWAAIKDLPADCQIPQGVAAAIEAAYRASLNWVEWLDRKPEAKP